MKPRVHRRVFLREKPNQNETLEPNVEDDLERVRLESMEASDQVGGWGTVQAWARAEMGVKGMDRNGRVKDEGSPLVTHLEGTKESACETGGALKNGGNPGGER